MRSQAIDLAPKGKLSTELYKMEITILEFDLSEFYEDKKSKKYIPGKGAIDKIAEAAGVSFIGDNCTVTAEDRSDSILGERTVFVGRAQGRIRMTDGSMRESSVCEYEFDPVGRVYEDFKVWENKSRVEKDPWDPSYKHEVDNQSLQNMKVGRQRANTGARLRVIRELIGMPNGFYKDEVETMGLRFGRVIQNTDYILQTPEGRILASAQALGLDVAKVFGAYMNARPVEKIAQPKPLLIPDQETTIEDEELRKPSEPEPVSDIPEEIKPSEPDIVLDQFLTQHKEVLNGKSTTGNPYTMGKDLLRKPHSEEDVQAMIDRVKKYLEKRGITA